MGFMVLLRVVGGPFCVPSKATLATDCCDVNNRKLLFLAREANLLLRSRLVSAAGNARRWCAGPSRNG